MTGCAFQDVSGTAIQLGRYDTFNVTDPAQQEAGNSFTDNAIDNVAAEYVRPSSLFHHQIVGCRLNNCTHRSMELWCVERE